MKIRYAKEQDWQAIYQLICELEEERLGQRVFLSYFQRNLKHSDVVYLIAEEKDEIFGFVSLLLHHPLHHCVLIGELKSCVWQTMQGINR